MTSAHSTRNTTIRTRKIRGEDSLVSSISIAEREEGLEAIAADHVAGFERVVVAGDAAEDTAGLAHDDLSRRDVPRLQVAFPVTVEAAGGDKSHIQRGCSEPTQTRHLGLNFGHLGARQIEVAATHMWQPAGDHAFVQFAPAGNAQPLIVEEGALAAFSGIEFVISWIVDHARDDGVLALQRD